VELPFFAFVACSLMRKYNISVNTRNAGCIFHIMNSISSCSSSCFRI